MKAIICELIYYFLIKIRIRLMLLFDHENLLRNSCSSLSPQGLPNDKADIVKTLSLYA